MTTQKGERVLYVTPETREAFQALRDAALAEGFDPELFSIMSA